MSTRGSATRFRAQTIITPEFLLVVEKLLARRSVCRVCRLLSLPRQTFYSWKQEGHALRERSPREGLLPRAKLLVDFCNAVERGSAQKASARAPAMTDLPTGPSA